MRAKLQDGELIYPPYTRRSTVCKIIAVILLATGARAFDATPLMSFFQTPASTWTTIPNLVSQWKMNDNAASTVVIDSKSTNTGTSARNTSTLTVSGRINTALKFERASSDFIGVGPGSQLNISGDITISAWVYLLATDAGDINTVVAKCVTGSPYDQYFIYEQGGNIRMRVRNTSASVFEGIKTSAGTNQWQFVCGVISGTTVTAYVNGSSAGGTSATVTGTRATVTASTRIGKLHDGAPYLMRGNMDDVRIYNRALTQAEITALYNSGNGTELE